MTDNHATAEYAIAVVNAVVDRAEVILVASSMGGFTAPIVCNRRRVDLFVLLNGMIPVTGETFNQWWSNIRSGPARREYHASLGFEARGRHRLERVEQEHELFVVPHADETP